MKEGQILFELDPSDQRVAVASAQARVAAARARAAAARAQLAEIVLQRDRERRLADTGAVAAATADDLTARGKSLEEQVRATDADVSASQAEVNALASNLANTTIRAPIDGTVMNKPLLPGDVVSPGTPMARIADFTSIVVETDVPEGRLQLVSKGRPCEIVLDAYPDKRWRGEVVEVSPQLNRAKATATVKVRFLDRDETRPARDGRARRRSWTRRSTREAGGAAQEDRPGQAVVDRAGARMVFVADGGKVHLQSVTLGKPFGDGFELVEGPAPGTKLVERSAGDPGRRTGDQGEELVMAELEKNPGQDDAQEGRGGPGGDDREAPRGVQDVHARRRGRARARRPRSRRASRARTRRSWARRARARPRSST